MQGYSQGGGPTGGSDKHSQSPELRGGPLTVLRLEVAEAELRALAGDEQLSVEGEDHGLVLHVDHAAHHVALAPRAAEVAAAHVHAPALGEQRDSPQGTDARCQGPISR